MLIIFSSFLFFHYAFLPFFVTLFLIFTQGKWILFFPFHSCEVSLALFVSFEWKWMMHLPFFTFFPPSSKMDSFLFPNTQSNFVLNSFALFCRERPFFGFQYSNTRGSEGLSLFGDGADFLVELEVDGKSYLTNRGSGWRWLIASLKSFLSIRMWHCSCQCCWCWCCTGSQKLIIGIKVDCDLPQCAVYAPVGSRGESLSIGCVGYPQSVDDVASVCFLQALFWNEKTFGDHPR